MNSAVLGPSSPRFPTRLGPTTYGHIGIDIGSHGIEIAQWMQRRNRRTPYAQWWLPLPTQLSATDLGELSSLMEFFGSQWPELKAMFRGARTAVALPTRWTPLRVLEVPEGTDQEMHAMICDELSDELGSSSPFTFAYWPNKPAENGLANVTAVVVDHQTSEIVTSALLGCGLECRVLDARPCALARAAETARRKLTAAGADGPGKAAAVLELGRTTSQLVFCLDGEPGFCRTLPECGLASAFESLQSRLQLSESESDLLLSEVGLPASRRRDRAASTIGAIMEPPIDHILLETQRTLEYASHQYAGRFPQRLWLSGEGSEIRNLACYVADKLSMDVHVLDTQPSGWNPRPSAFAVAGALSTAGLKETLCK